MLLDGGMRTQADIDHEKRQARIQTLTRELAELSPITPYSLRLAKQIMTEVADLLAAERRYSGMRRAPISIVSPEPSDSSGDGAPAGGPEPGDAHAGR